MDGFIEASALIVAALFTGAAFYISFAEHPARMKLATGAALLQWRASYARGLVMQSSLAIIGFALGVGAAFTDGDVRWFLGGLLMAANWPYTLMIIMPLNKNLLAIEPDYAPESARAMLGRWNFLHAGRTALGAAALVCMGWAAA